MYQYEYTHIAGLCTQPHADVYMCVCVCVIVCVCARDGSSVSQCWGGASVFFLGMCVCVTLIRTDDNGGARVEERNIHPRTPKSTVGTCQLL